MKNAILICTNNLIPKNLLRYVVENAINQSIRVGDTEIVVVSHYPVVENFKTAEIAECKNQIHEKLQQIIIKEPVVKPFSDVKISNYVIGEKEYSIDTIFKQMLFGSSKTDSETIVVMEHDILYPPNYVFKSSGIINSGFDICFWQSSCFFSLKGFFRVKNMALSRYSFNREFFDGLFTEKMLKKSLITEPFLTDYESVIFMNTDERFYGNHAVVVETEVLDIKHGFNTSGQCVVEKCENDHPFWGKIEDVAKLIDDNYKDAMSKNTNYSFGLW